MRIMIVGSGLMGPAAAFNALQDPAVSQVVVCDADQSALATAADKLRRLTAGRKVHVQHLDVRLREAASAAMRQCEVVLTALPWSASIAAISAALAAHVPLVDLARPDDEQMPAVRREVADAEGFVMLGCGLEPGLTEIMARHLAEQLDRVDELHIKCGGIPEKPAPPLGYKIVFGGRQLPFHESDALIAQDGHLVPVPRYSGVETVHFAGAGEFEAWHEGFMPWLLELPALKHLRLGTQKTIRWPGYAAKVTVLKDLGLLSHRPVEVDGISVIPKKVVDAVLYPHVRLRDGEPDMTVFRVEAIGEKNGQRLRLRMDMVDRYDAVLGFTSMARTTSFTGAIVARMIGRGDLQGHGLITPERVIAGPLFDRLVAELATNGIRFETSVQQIA